MPLSRKSPFGIHSTEPASLPRERHGILQSSPAAIRSERKSSRRPINRRPNFSGDRSVVGPRNPIPLLPYLLPPGIPRGIAAVTVCTFLPSRLISGARNGAVFDADRLLLRVTGEHTCSITRGHWSWMARSSSEYPASNGPTRLTPRTSTCPAPHSGDFWR